MELYIASISKLINDNPDFKFSSNTFNRLKHATTQKRINEIKATEILFSYVFKDYDSLTIGVSNHGKPFFNENKIKFNYGHSKDLIALGVSKNPIGVDIEFISPKASKVTRMFINDDEQAFNVSKESATLIWTIKEAVIKKLDLDLSKLKDIKIINIKKNNDYLVSKASYNKKIIYITSIKYSEFFISYTGKLVKDIKII